MTLGLLALHPVHASPLQVAAWTGTAPVVDGRLDEPFWQGMPPLGRFMQAAPVAGAEPTRQTTLFVAHDGATLYVAVRAQEPTAAALVARTLRRDGETIDNDDHVAIVLDPQGTGRNGFVFRVNALGAKRDGLIADGSVTRADWDTLWDAAVQMDAQGWTVEVAIPLSALAAPADGRAWGFNVERHVAASGERMRLFGATPEREVDSLTDAGRLAGVVPARQGWGLRLRPAVRWSTGRTAGHRSAGRLEPSLDATLGVTPTLSATLTINSDFSDADLDDRVVSLSRFELFRPEKRSFFTQDAGRFGFGGLDVEEPVLVPFFSRRIGLGSSLDAGLKLSGTAGPVELGAFAVQVPGRGGGPSARMAVARAAIGLGESQRVGLVATQGTPEGLGRNRLHGLDYQFRSTRFAGERTLEAYAWTQRSDDEAQGSGTAHGASLRFPNVGLTGQLDWYDIGEAFRPALGYVRETGVRITDASIGWRHLGTHGASLITSVHAGGRTRHDGTERGRYAGLSLEWFNTRGDYLLPEFYVEHDRLAKPFEALPGVQLAAGEHRFGYAVLSAGASASRAWSGEASLRAGGFHDGQLNEQTLKLTWRPHPRWSVGPGWACHQLQAGDRSFTARTVSLRLEHTPSTRSAQSLSLQHDNVSRQTLLGLRARWALARGQEFRLAIDRTNFGPAQTAATKAPSDYRVTAAMRWALER
ncbi:carbohydrate binding family 9 domain-containing protein [Azohydromonas aeria]|uniref:carbohydrate binding family 9 domain-containing protein n=1 Tax=Azohydromonas aeria TaxID=2590212 RepID=UPI0018DFD41E|nr:carbohydrate binding family 9 domain-containing protein [Azohydromonas aeria]